MTDTTTDAALEANDTRASGRGRAVAARNELKSLTDEARDLRKQVRDLRKQLDDCLETLVRLAGEDDER